MGAVAALVFALLAELHQQLVVGLLLGSIFFLSAPANAVLLAAQVTCTPLALQGSAMSASYLIAGLVAPLGPPLAGAALDHTGPTTTFLGIATATALVSIAVHLRRSTGHRTGARAARALLTERLQRRGVAASVHVVGGVAVALQAQPRRLTLDVDAMALDEAVFEEAEAMPAEKAYRGTGSTTPSSPGCRPDRSKPASSGRPPAWMCNLALPEHLLAMKMARSATAMWTTVRTWPKSFPSRTSRPRIVAPA